MAEITGTEVAEYLQGGSADDRILALSGDDFLYGLGGDDILMGGAGDDTYRFNVNDGDDVITDLEGSNSLQFVSGNLGNHAEILSSAFSISGYDLVISLTVGEYSQRVTISDYYRGSSSFTIFYNTSKGGSFSELSLDLLPIMREGDSTDDTIVGGLGSDFLSGGAGSDVIYGGDGADRIDGGDDDDILYGEAGNDTLFGGRGDDIIYGDSNEDTISESAQNGFSSQNAVSGTSTGGSDTLSGDSSNDTLDGGEGDDILKGGAGDDTYIFQQNFGHDDIEDTSGAEKLFFKVAGGLEDFSISLNNNGETFISTAEGSVTIPKFYYSDGRYSIHFGTNDELLGKLSFGIPGDADDMMGEVGRDWLLGLDGDDILEGGAGDDILEGGAGDDILEGGAGEDVLNGGNGIDTASYGSSDIPVRVNLLASSQNAGDAYGDSYVLIENVLGSAYQDFIIGDGGANSLWGGKGSDTLAGGSGDDVYHFSVGDGMDWLSDDGGEIYFNSGSTGHYVASDFYASSFNKKGDNLEINLDVGGTRQRVTIIDYYDNPGAFSIGYNTVSGGAYTTVSAPDFIIGTASDETITGTSGNDVIRGGDGNDILMGGAGHDAYYFSPDTNYYYDRYGSEDTIIDSDGGSIYFESKLFGSYSSRDFYSGSFSRNGNDLEIDSYAFGDRHQVTITDYFSNPNLFTFFYNEELGGDYKVVPLKNFVTGTSGDDSGSNALIGTSDVDDIAGLAGDDVLQGGAGNDILYGGAGDDDYIFNVEDINNYGGSDRIIDVIGSNNIYFRSSASGDYQALTADNFALSRYDLVITIQVGEAEQKITIEDYYESSNSATYRFYYEDSSGIVHSIDASIVPLYEAPVTSGLIGGANRDRLSGGSGNDYIYGGAGDDSLSGDGGAGAGADVIYGGAGDDIIHGDGGAGAGADVIYGGAGDDIIHGDGGGGAGADVIYGGAGDDIIHGDAGGGGSGGHDELHGGAGNDRIYGDGGGGRGNDQYYGGKGDDYLSDRYGDEEYYFYVGDGIDTIRDNYGSNSVYFSSSSSGNYQGLSAFAFAKVYQNLQIYATVGGIEQRVTIDNYYSDPNSFSIYYNSYSGGEYRAVTVPLLTDITGTSNADTLTGTNISDVVYGLIGNDHLYGAGGDDYLHGEEGDDHLYGGDGDDHLYGDEEPDGAAGNDDLFGEGGDDEIEGGAGDDNLYGGAGDDALFAGIGNDNLYGGAGDDALYGRSRYSHLYDVSVTKFLDGGIGDDKYYFSGGGGTYMISDTDGGELYFRDGSYGQSYASAFSATVFIRDGDDLQFQLSTSRGTQDFTITDYFLIPDKFTIKHLDNGGGYTEVMVSLTRTPVTVSTFTGASVTGTTGDDSLLAGTSGADIIMGLAGADHLYGKGGDDELHGGAGDDMLMGGDSSTDEYHFIVGDGMDRITDTDGGIIYFNSSSSGVYALSDFSASSFAKHGNDLEISLNIDGVSQKVTITDYYNDPSRFVINYNQAVDGDYGIVGIGGAGDDTLIGGAGDDIMHGGAGDDTIYGGSDNDTLIGGIGDDTLDGGRENDTLIGGAGNDTLDGSWDNDTLIGGTGDDTLRGSWGNDKYYFSVGDGNDTIDDFRGHESIYFRSSASGNYQALRSSDFTRVDRDLHIDLTVSGISQQVIVTNYYGRHDGGFSIYYNTSDGGTDILVSNSVIP